MKLSWTLWGLVLVGLLCPIARAQEMDDLDLEDMDDIIDEDELPEEEPKVIIPKERPVYKKPELKGPAHFADSFESEADFNKRWVTSKARKDDTDDSIAKYDGVWAIEEATSSAVQGNLGLVLKSRAKHHAVAAKLDRTYEFSGKPFIVQYEVQFQNGQECGGAYIKLLTKDDKMDLAQFKDNTPYTIMFGPDKCGNDNKLHFIFRHKNPITGKFEEKHAKKPSSSIDSFFTDKKTHLFTLVVNPDNTFEIFVDNSMVNSGSLLEDVEPPVNPPKEIVDPDDKKPADWDERERIADPEAVKPDDWDETQPEMIPDEDAVKPDGWLDEEPELIPDPDAEKPSDWDEDMDGEWEAPMKSNPECENAPGCGEWKRPSIKNPEYKGKWKAPMIDNPEYKGKWKPKKIPNPDYFEDNEPYLMTPIDAVGLELWSMSDNILFNHFIITDDKMAADQWAADTWEIIRAQELAASGGASVVDAVMDATRDRPWLWAVFILVVVLPIILLIAYCCMSGSPSKPDDIAQRKKTDEPTEDDEAEEEEEEEEEEKSKTKKEPAKKEEGSGDATKKKSKSDLEEDASQADVEEEGEEEEEKKEADTPSERRSPRRRKAKVPKE